MAKSWGIRNRADGGDGEERAHGTAFVVCYKPS